MENIRLGGRRSEATVYEMCSKYYLIELWALAYHRTIYPVPHVSTWDVPEEIQKLFALPFDYDKTKGRNQEERFPGTGESRKKKKKTSNKPQLDKNLGKWFQPVRSDT
ncbi:unnamed protein product [Microthlaspi erraticum]|uniref:Uncharacterized protein n=1 Tax=Microthlaspi erraticum TaxID=1685480 RepID=A0A6D2JT76_9BRAS|nr:unnamed protein product [Microthlaspi erraticum]